MREEKIHFEFAEDEVNNHFSKVYKYYDLPKQMGIMTNSKIKQKIILISSTSDVPEAISNFF